jgi:DNA invertase Pin-like site-specific DNA recombinase
MKRLPSTLDDLRGLRAARWIRESSSRQRDKYGPDAQKAMQDRAIAELGLIDTGLEWNVAKSGWSGPESMEEPPATLTPEFRAMLKAAEQGCYDVLLVGFTSRFIRDLALALQYRRTFHRLGVAILLADDNILTSNDADWERFADKAKAAEVYSRDLSKNIRSGYATKRERDRDPGGHAPLGFRRRDDLVEPDPEALPTVQLIFALSAAGKLDREVAAVVGLPISTVRGVLTSPLYLGRLRDGGPARWRPLVDAELAQQASAHRERRATNAGHPAAPSRPYALSMLRCASCGIRLIGDTGYYRHRGDCAAFNAATPDRPRGWHGRRDGKGYRRALYENAVGRVLDRVSFGATSLTSVVGLVTEPPSSPDRLALARIERERDSALARYRRDRDSGALDRAMARLDAEQQEASRPREVEGVPADVAVRYLRELSKTWAKADGGPGRRMLAEALFERIEVLGAREATIHLTDAAVAYGFAAAIPDRLDVTVGYGRGERNSTVMSDAGAVVRFVRRGRTDSGAISA